MAGDLSPDARRNLDACPHGVRLACYAHHAPDDKRLGTPLCLDCYDHDAQVVWNVMAGELWRRTHEGLRKRLRRLARHRGIDPDTVRLSFGKAAEMQRRAVIHYHAIVRLDGVDPNDSTAILPPPPGIDAQDLADLIDQAARTAFTTPDHPARPGGWRIAWGDQVHTKIITVAAEGQVTDAQVAAYLAKYATKSTEATGHASNRLTDDTVNLYADPDGTHTERLIEACWTLGGPRWPLHGPVCARICRHPSCARIANPPAWRPTLSGPVCRRCPHRSCAEIRTATTDPAAPWRGLRRWAHMLGFGGHFLTKSRRYSITFALLRGQRVVFRRAQAAGPERDAIDSGEPTTLVVNFLQFVGAGWQTPADAMLANTSAAMAREHQQAAREALMTLAA